MALILKDDNGLIVTQSVIGQIPTGVHISPLKIDNGLPQFSFRPNLTERWEELYDAGRLEFRRLIFSSRVELEYEDEVASYTS